MTPHDFSLSRRRTLLGLGASLAQLAGCGGGSGTVDTAGLSSGGTGSFTTGTVSGLGSIIVNGIRYTDDSARVTHRDDGMTAPTPKVGMVVSIQGSTVAAAASSSSLATATAYRITYGSEWQGPVDSLSVSGSTFTVLGLSVDVTAATVFDGVAASLARLSTSHYVEIHGYLDSSTGHLLATRVESTSTAPSSYRVSGSVATLDTARRRLTLVSGTTTLTVDYASTSSVPSNLSVGNLVRVSIAPSSLSAGVWSATRVQAVVSPLADFDGGDNDDAEIHGSVTAYTSATAFSVNGIPVNASGAHLSGVVKLGAEVEVTGLVVGGVIQATRVEVKSKADAETRSKDFLYVGVFSALDTSAKTFVLKGYTFHYDSSTKFSGIDWSTGTTPTTITVQAQLTSSGTWLAIEIKKGG